MRSGIAYLLCLVFAACGFAAKPLGHQICVASCYYSLLAVKYEGSNKTQETSCTNPLRVNSTYMCMRQHCAEEVLEPGIAWWASNCKHSAKVINLKAYKAATANATAKYLAGLPTVEYKDKAVATKVSVPSAKSWTVVYGSATLYDSLQVYNHMIRWSQYGFWGLVLFVGVGQYAWSFMPPKRRSQSSGTAEEAQGSRSKKPTGLSKLKACVNNHLLMAPTFTYHHHQAWGWFTIPLRIQSMVIASYIILHVVIISTHYRLLDEDYYYKSKKSQVLRILGDRLASFTTSAVPFIFLFAGRGNLLILVTGWSHRTFNIFHRWIAIIMTIEGIIHGVIFAAFYVTQDSWDYYRSELKTDSKELYGIMMVTALGISLALSIKPVRDRAYELFKTSHIGLSAIFLAALFQYVSPTFEVQLETPHRRARDAVTNRVSRHVKTQFQGIYRVWVWVTIGVWCLDYAVRLLRLLLMNYKAFIGKNTPALASYSEETGMIRLQVYPSMSAARQTPGTYYYLYFPSWRFWEAHPFTLSGRSVQVDDTLPNQSGQASNQEKGTQSPRITELSPGQSESYLTFMMRPRDGMTRRLRDSLKGKGSSGQRRVRVLLEGPYGSPARLGHFDDILFIAGGSGITAVLPYIRMFFEDRAGSQHTPNVRLAWAMRNEEFARDVLANDLRLTEGAALAATKLNMEFYITSDDASSSAPKPEDSDSNDARHDSRFRRVRPEIDTLVSSFMAEVQGRAAVFVCGPAGMADMTRSAVRKHAKQGESEVELFEEMFCL